MDDPLSAFFGHDHPFELSSAREATFGTGATTPASSPEDFLSIFDGLEGVCEFPPMTPLVPDGSITNQVEEEMKRNDQRRGHDDHVHVSQKSSSSMTSLPQFESPTEVITNVSCPSSPPKKKRQKVMSNPPPADEEEGDDQRLQKMSHITVERNRRKQMNEHLSVLRSLMPCFYVKRGDQASIIGGVVDYITELQTLLQSLESKKQRKAYTEVLSPRLISSPRLVSSPRTSSAVNLSPTKKPPLSPRLNNLPISPRTPTPGSPYNRSRSILSHPYQHQHQHHNHLSSSSPPPPAAAPSIVHELISPRSSTTNSPSTDNINDTMNELVANLRSPVVDVEVKFSGPNVQLKTVSSRIHGQATKIISTLEHLSLEILNLNINTIEETMIISFTIKIGIECRLSAEELAHQIQQTFC